MPRLSTQSRDKLMTCHPILIKIVLRLIKTYDVKVVDGHRNQAWQNEAFASGHSTKEWPDSTHNRDPSEGIDIVPYPSIYRSTLAFYVMAGRFMQIADDMNVTVRWGGDWDSDDDLHDQNFMDLGHFEVLLSPAGG